MERIIHSNEHIFICDKQNASQIKTLIFEKKELQIYAGQDMVQIGELPNGDKWMVVADGHGIDKVINALRIVDWSIILSQKNPEDNIFPVIELLGNTYGSGSTLSLVRINSNSIECMWIGNSTIQIYEDDINIFHSISHNAKNDEEIKRLETLDCHENVIDYKILNKYELINEFEITMTEIKYINFGDNYKKDFICMTNSLGHNQRTGKYIQKQVIPLLSNKQYCVTVASDGIWDMLVPNDYKFISTIPLNQIIDIVEHRWNKQWTLIGTRYEKSLHRFQTGDDICIAIWKGCI